MNNTNNHHRYLLLLIFVLAVISFGCGKNDKVEDYGNSDGAELATDSDVDMAAGSLRDRLGDEIIWQDSFSVGNVNCNIDIDYIVPDIEQVPIFKLNRIADLSGREQDILKTLFGNNYSEIHDSYDGIMFYEEGPMMWKLSAVVVNLWEAHDINGINENNQYKDTETYDTWVESDDYVLHTYTGQFEGKEFYAVIFEDIYEKSIYLNLIPVNLSGFTDGGEYNYYNVYSGFEGPSDFRNNISHEETDNLCYDRQDELIIYANDFLNNKLNAFGAMGMEYEYISQFSGTSSNDESNDDLVLKPVQVGYGDQESPENWLMDGYVFVMNMYIDGIFSANIGPSFAWSGGGCMYISSNGLVEASIKIYADYAEPYTDNTSLLDIETVKGIFKDTLNSSDYEVARNAAKNIYYDSMYFAYYPIINPENDNEFSYVPVWVIGNLYRSIVINAVDGSIVYMD